MAAKKPTARKRTAKKTAKRPATRGAVAKRPSRHNSPAERFAAWLARSIARHAKAHRDGVRIRRDAAIMRATHKGCQVCQGSGVLVQRKKDGSYNGSKPCPAKPAVMKVSRREVRVAARFGPDKRSGLIGWTCPCGKREKPRYRDAKGATAALREHEKRRHGGHTVGGAWYVQMPEQAQPAPPEPAPVAKTTSRKDSGKTDQQWTKQNPTRTPKGGCTHCKGKGAKYGADGGKQTITVCQPCSGTGKATVAAA